MTISKGTAVVAIAAVCGVTLLVGCGKPAPQVTPPAVTVTVTAAVPDATQTEPAPATTSAATSAPAATSSAAPAPTGDGTAVPINKTYTDTATNTTVTIISATAGLVPVVSEFPDIPTAANGSISGYVRMIGVDVSIDGTASTLTQFWPDPTSFQIVDSAGDANTCQATTSVDDPGQMDKLYTAIGAGSDRTPFQYDPFETQKGSGWIFCDTDITNDSDFNTGLALRYTRDAAASDDGQSLVPAYTFDQPLG